MSYDLKNLRTAAEEACHAAFDEQERPEGAINWGDLGCISAERYEMDNGQTGYRVYISEADPGAWQLQAYVADELEKAGFHEVEVVTEW